jgi:hypothetical protein
MDKAWDLQKRLDVQKQKNTESPDFKHISQTVGE